MFVAATTNLAPTLILDTGSQLPLPNSRSQSDQAQSTVTLAPSSSKQQCPLRSVRVISVGEALIQNVRRGHYELATDVDPRHRLALRSPSSRAPSDLRAIDGDPCALPHQSSAFGGIDTPRHTRGCLN
jgi:hypothetical protein